MDFGAWIGDYLKTNGLATFLVLWGVWFVTVKLWPWWSNVYIPQRIQIEKGRELIWGGMLAELRAGRNAVGDLRDRFCWETHPLPVSDGGATAVDPSRS